MSSPHRHNQANQAEVLSWIGDCYCRPDGLGICHNCIRYSLATGRGWKTLTRYLVKWNRYPEMTDKPHPAIKPNRRRVHRKRG